MKASKLVKELKDKIKKHGDFEVTMQATLLQDGFSVSEGGRDVFESTVENMEIDTVEPFGLRGRLYWQC